MSKKLICNQCLLEKDSDEFYRQNKIDKNGNKYIYINPKCKQCCSQNSSNRTDEEYEKHRLQNLEDYRLGKAKPVQLKNSRKRRLSGQYLEWQRSDSGKEKSKAYAEKRKIKKHEISIYEWNFCKQYFNNCCAYCEFPIEEHFRKYRNDVLKSDFHKEHVENNGSNFIDNCIPSCVSCNTSKYKKSFEDWYNEQNPIFSIERYNKIISWVTEDYKMAITQ